MTVTAAITFTRWGLGQTLPKHVSLVPLTSTTGPLVTEVETEAQGVYVRETPSS